MNTKINLMGVWKQNQHLNFGEIRQAVEKAELALNDELVNITRTKFAHARKDSTSRRTH